METAEIYAKTEDDLAYAHDILQKACAQLEKVITRRKIAEANILALVSKEQPLKLFRLADGRYVLVEWNTYRGDIKVIQSEPETPAAVIWGSTREAPDAFTGGDIPDRYRA